MIIKQIIGHFCLVKSNLKILDDEYSSYSVEVGSIIYAKSLKRTSNLIETYYLTCTSQDFQEVELFYAYKFDRNVDYEFEIIE